MAPRQGTLRQEDLEQADQDQEDRGEEEEQELIGLGTGGGYENSDVSRSQIADEQTEREEREKTNRRKKLPIKDRTALSLALAHHFASSIVSMCTTIKDRNCHCDQVSRFCDVACFAIHDGARDVRSGVTMARARWTF